MFLTQKVTLHHECFAIEGFGFAVGALGSENSRQAF